VKLYVAVFGTIQMPPLRREKLLSSKIDEISERVCSKKLHLRGCSRELQSLLKETEQQSVHGNCTRLQ
jgi:hypothetical protein